MVVLDQLNETDKETVPSAGPDLVVIEETLGQGTHQRPGEGGEKSVGCWI